MSAANSKRKAAVSKVPAADDFQLTAQSSGKAAKQPSEEQQARFEKLMSVQRQVLDLDPISAEVVSFSPRAMVYCGLPYKQPTMLNAAGKKVPAVYYERQFSHVLMRIGTMQPSLGLPFGGMARLILSYVTECAVRRGTKTISLADNIGDMLRQFGIESITGGARGSITSLRKQFLRLRYANFLIRWSRTGTTFPDGTSAPPDMYSTTDSMFSIIRDASLWQRNPQGIDTLNFDDDSKYFIELSDDFFNEITKRPVPIDMRAYRALLTNPMAMDLYVYLSYLSSYVKKPFVLPWELLRDQFRPNIPRLARFKSDFTTALKDVDVVYPNLKVELDNNTGLTIKPGSVPSVPRSPSAALIREV